MLVALLLMMTRSDRAAAASIWNETDHALLHNGLNSTPSWLIANHLRFQVGNTIALDNGLEISYGLSNGIAWFPEYTRFIGIVQVGFGELNVNVLGLAYDFVRRLFVSETWKGHLLHVGFRSILCSTYALSVKILDFVKLNFFSLGSLLWGVILSKNNTCVSGKCDVVYEKSDEGFSRFYNIFSPRIQIDILKCMEFFGEN